MTSSERTAESLLAAPEFCRSCGRPGASGLITCPSCGRSLVPSVEKVEASSLYGIGVKTEGTRKAGKGTFPIIEDDGRKWTVLSMDGEAIPLKKKHGELSPVLKNAGPVRRWLAWCNHAVSEKGLSEFWNRALRSAQDEWDRRAMAAWAVSRTRPELLETLDLSSTENAWLRAHSEVRAGRFAEAVDAISRLEPGTYPDIIELIGNAARRGAASEAATLAAHVDGVAAAHPLNKILANSALADWADIWAGDATVLQHVKMAAAFARSEAADVPGTGALADLAAAERSLALGAELPVPITAEIMTPSWFLALLWQHRHNPIDLEVITEPAALPSTWVPYVDDLLECWGRLSAQQRDWMSQVIAASSDDSAWIDIRARLSTLREEGEASSPCEAARRAYAEKDWSYLRNAGAPGDHFLALADLRDGDVESLPRLLNSECLPDGDESRLHLLERALRGEPEPLADLIDDPTTWETLVRIHIPDSAVEAAPIRFQEWFRLTKGKQTLYDDDFAGASAIARECLRISTIEEIRDEALNLLGVSLLLAGNNDGSAAALRKAVEGAYSDRLLVNWALAVEASDSDGAFDAWMDLATKASAIRLRAQAAARALDLAGDVDDGRQPLVSVARELLFADVPSEVALGLLSVAGNHDEEWVKQQDWKTSPHWDSNIFKVRVAMYQDEDHLKLLGELLRQSPEDDQLKGMRDGIVDSIMDIMKGESDADDAHLTAGWGLRMLDVVPLKPRQEAILCLWSVRAALIHLGSDYADDEVPGERLLEFLSRAQALAESDVGSPDFSGFVREEATDLRDEFVRQNVAWHAHAHDAAVDAYNGMIQNISSIGSGYRIDKSKVRAAAADFERACDQHLADMRKLIPLISDPELREASQGLERSWNELKAASTNLRTRV